MHLQQQEEKEQSIDARVHVYTSSSANKDAGGEKMGVMTVG